MLRKKLSNGIRKLFIVVLKLLMNVNEDFTTTIVFLLN